MPEFINGNHETETLPDTLKCADGSIEDVIIYRLPAYWASYLINGDATGFDYHNTPDDPNAGDRYQAEVDAWLESEGNPWVVDCGPSHFSWRNDANNMGGDVCEYVAHVRRREVSND